MENYDFFNYLMKGGNLEDFKKRDNEDNLINEFNNKLNIEKSDVEMIDNFKKQN